MPNRKFTNQKVKTRIQRRVYKLISKEVNRVKSEIMEEVLDVVEDAWEENVTVRELKNNGKLVGDLGLQNPVKKIDSIKETFIRNSVRVSKTRLLKKGQPYLVGQIVFPERALLSAKAGFQPNLRRDSHGNFTIVGPNSPLHWLEWLLLRGQDVIIIDHEVSRGKNLGRSGQRAVMRKGGSFKVPIIHSGTSDDNFITRITVDNIDKPRVKFIFRILINSAAGRAANKFKRGIR